MVHVMVRSAALFWTLCHRVLQLVRDRPKHEPLASTLDVSFHHSGDGGGGGEYISGDVFGGIRGFPVYVDPIICSMEPPGKSDRVP